MRHFAILLLLASSPVAAQDVEEERVPLPRGLENLLADLFSEVEPRLRELRDAIGNLDDYEAPEMLPNGDIIIRRKTPLDPDAEPEIEEEPEAEEGEPIDI